MATFADIQQTMVDAASAQAAQNVAIDDLVVRIQAIKAGQVMTQEELDSLNAQAQQVVTAAQDATARISVLAP